MRLAFKVVSRKKVNFTFFDAKGNQSIQNESIDKALKEDYNALIANLVDQRVSEIQGTINKIIQKNIPLIIYADPNQELLNYIRSYRRTIFVATDIKQAGILQGKILIDLWNTGREYVDKNNYGNKIEAIISNNDAMAIGAIKTLQKYGYNMGDKSKTIPVVGIDGITEGKELINKGFMAGTVVQDPREKTEVFYSAAQNMVLGIPPLSNTKYKFDETGIVIRLPYYEYTRVSGDTINIQK